MRIGIDARFAVRQPRRGIGAYSVNLLKELVALDCAVEFVLYVDNEDYENILPSGPNVRLCRLWPSSYPVWEQFVLPLAVQRDKIDLLHTLGNTAPLWVPAGTQLVLSLMDVMFLQSGEFIPSPTTLYQRAGRVYRAWVAPSNARRARSVITISDFSRQDILKLIPDLPALKVVPIHLACDPRFTPATQIPSTVTSRPFLLCLGAEDPRKNTLRIVTAFIAAIRTNCIEYDLVITGYVNWEHSSAYQIVKDAGVNDRVKFLSYVSIEKLADLYQRATAFLYLSLYEGFGIPVLEAYATGCPVIASNTTSIPEIGGDAAIYVDPKDIGGIRAAIVLLCKDKQLQNKLRARGTECAKQFSWKITALKTLEVYRNAFQQS